MPGTRTILRVLLLTACSGLTAGPARAAAGGMYRVQAVDTKATVGVKVTTAVLFSTRQGWHLNAEAPFTLKLTPDAGLTVAKERLTRADLAHSTENHARFDVALTAEAPGQKTVKLEAGFVICKETECRPIKEKLVLRVDASAPAVPAAKQAKPARK
jgi:hypothetical protein